MPADPVFNITYWGVTGTLPAPLKPEEVTDKVVRSLHHLLETGRLKDLRPGSGSLQEVRRRVEESLPFHLRSTFGANTTCVEVQTPDSLLILDCGTGCRELGIALQARWGVPGYDGERAAHVLVTHPHMDHTFATPFVDPFFDPANHFTVWGSRSVLDALSAILSYPAPLSQTFFPPTFDLLKGIKDFREVKIGSSFAIGSTRVSTHALNHPGGCLAYRFDNAGRSFVFATDHEQATTPDLDLAAFAAEADLLYLDGQYLVVEYDGFQGIEDPHALLRHGWGHGTVEACIATAAAARVRQVHVGHRDPRRTDENIARLERYVRRLLAEELLRTGREPFACRADIPYEGMKVQL